MAASDKRATAFAAQSSMRSHQRRQNGGQRTTGFFRIFVANRIGVLEENFECEPRQLSANDSELLMPSSASLVTLKAAGLRLHLVAPRQRLSPTDNGGSVKWRRTDGNNAAITGRYKQGR